MENDTEVWDGTFVEYFGEARVAVTEYQGGMEVNASELFRELKNEMREEGYIPIAGTEEVDFKDKPVEIGQVINIEYSAKGKWYGPDARKIEYVTESGEITWRNTDRNKSSRLLTN